MAEQQPNFILEEEQNKQLPQPTTEVVSTRTYTLVELAAEVGTYKQYIELLLRSDTDFLFPQLSEKGTFVFSETDRAKLKDYLLLSNHGHILKRASQILNSKKSLRTPFDSASEKMEHVDGDNEAFISVLTSLILQIPSLTDQERAVAEVAMAGELLKDHWRRLGFESARKADKALKSAGVKVTEFLFITRLLLQLSKE